MKKTYNEIMEKIELTDKMRERILQKIQDANLKEPSKDMQFYSYKKYLSIAACFVILLVGAITVPNLFQGEEMERPPDLLEQIPDIVEVASKNELSEMVGFKVKDVKGLPFEVTEKTYLSYWKEMAEITYSGDEQSAVYRMSMGEEDNSGDYNTYGSVIEVTFHENTVILKGNDHKYSLALWNDKEYSYSLQITNGISRNDWLTMLDTINKPNEDGGYDK